ncbi:MAG TPA: hypothetical protein VF498_16330 [Anaerolineales bacterium]
MSAASSTTRQKVLRLLEWAFAVFGAAVCLAVVDLFALQQLDELWPLPGLYFIEIVLLGLLGVTSRLGDTNPASAALWGAIPWGVGGALLSFVILGGFSIGPFLIPAMLAFWLAGAIADLRQGRSIAGHLGLAVMAALFQGALIFAVLFLFLSPQRH